MTCGYKIYRNFFSAELINTLKTFVDSSLKRELLISSPVFRQSNFISSTYVRDINWKKKVYNTHNNILKQYIEDKLPGFKVCLVSSIKKIPGKNSACPLHQDPSFTDEEKYNTYTLWFPLHTIEKHHNSLFVVEGSHEKFTNKIRGVNIPYPFSFNENFSNKTYFNNLNQGDAVLYNSRMVHGSDTASIENLERTSVGVVLIEKKAPWLLYKREGDNQLNVYKMNKTKILYYCGDDFLYPGSPDKIIKNYVF
ncbi:MAG: hypothetical protein EBU90_02495 [Proteobacteria bacterium]|nr:hypothetical protein [Pseudomonadota bacterium]NBP13105.1 hypothetical protein [bacterium]